MAVLIILAICSDCGWERKVTNTGQASALFFTHKCKPKEKP